MRQEAKIAILITVIIVIISGLFFVKYIQKNEEPVSINVTQAKKEMKEELKDRELLLQAAESVPQEEHVGVLEFKDPSSEGMQPTIEGTIERFSASLSLKNQSQFLQAFDPQVMNDSLIAAQNVNNHEVISEFMAGIDRNGIKSMEIEKKTGMFGEQNTATLYIVYKDKYRTSVNLEFSQADAHFHDADSPKGQYLITTLIQNIIRQINDNLQEVDD
ncbi:hypothetical protein [Rossellomorea arthrocnemi]|uniref:hypothetical protein n=1 Tax=Rossellomorea arthrocnemi TaxID=2769542 RepID=UPI0019181C1A|nr:hypothetical protein [Rossellomorea arthrocnemi]